ncbi:hypothetical protein [Mycobacterium sp.]|jgi:hypothetical protein|uniref:hypothetical protein n=1 Tax=Mycobacterium sp. TaxID=1785 RepID=UPI002CA5D199|nr:hypothetical protein [Mycobacterium sp.]HXB87105.1 hypothetical protein [Mycobacterium sp.]
MTLVLGTAAGALLATGLIPLATAASARADGEDISPAADPGFISATDPLLALLGVTDIGAADPGENFEGMILNIPSLDITDVLTSGADPDDNLALLGVALPDDSGIGMAGVTVNTFVDTMNPALDSSFTIPFTDPLSGLWDILVANDFFGL